MMQNTESIDTTSYSELFPVRVIRLYKITVCNWSSFDGLHTCNIDENGTLITGVTGAGKSSLVDGMQTCLNGVSTHYNIAAAQGDSKDRDVLSYMRGDYGTEMDGNASKAKSKRPKAYSHSALFTLLKNTYLADDGSYISLMVVLTAPASAKSRGDVKKQYIVAYEDIDMAEVVQAFGKKAMAGIKELANSRQWIVENSYKSYKAQYCKALHIENTNAPNLLSRALGLKRIDDLTSLVRDFVLERLDVKSTARNVIGDFANLSSIKSKLDDVQARINVLRPLPELKQACDDNAINIAHCEDDLQGVDVFYATMFIPQVQSDITELDQKLIALNAIIEKSEQDKQAMNGQLNDAKTRYLQVGGNDIENLKTQLEECKAALMAKTKAAKRFINDCHALHLPTDLTETNLQSAKQSAKGWLEQHADTKHLLDKFSYAKQSEKATQSKISELEAELLVKKRSPDSNMRTDYLALRDKLVAELQLDDETVKFLAELIEVKPSDHAWQGAIERALGGKRMMLLVERSDKRKITQWLKDHHTGLRIQVEALEVNADKLTPPVFKTDGFTQKLTYKKHPYIDWVKRRLASDDLHCVESKSEFDNTEYSMLKEGLIQYRRNSFVKDDRSKISDTSNWFTGFSNAQRIAAIKSDLVEQQDELVKHTDEIARLVALSNEHGKTQSAYERIIDIDFIDIDVLASEQKKSELQDRIAELEQDRSLAELKSQIENFTAEIARLDNSLNENRSQRIVKQEKHTDLVNQEKRYNDTLDDPKSALECLPTTIDRLTRHPKAAQLKYDVAASQQVFKDALYAKQKSHGDLQNKIEREIDKVMLMFKAQERWLPHFQDWQDGLGGLDEYLEHYQQLVNEQFAELSGEFEIRMNKDLTDNVNSIKDELRSQIDNVHDRIEDINDVLRKVEYQSHTYLQLCAVKYSNENIASFYEKITRINQSISQSSASRYALIADFVFDLELIVDPDRGRNIANIERIDPRYQLTFKVEERLVENDKLQESYDSSSGKSGGEKERFSSAVLASTLAFALTPEGLSSPVFSTVFLDEAFSHTSDQVARRVVAIFKKLELHLNIITPFKSLDIAAEAVSSVTVVTRDEDRHESALTEFSWQEYQQQQDRHLLAQSNITIESVEG